MHIVSAARPRRAHALHAACTPHVHVDAVCTSPRRAVARSCARRRARLAAALFARCHRRSHTASTPHASAAPRRSLAAALHRSAHRSSLHRLCSRSRHFVSTHYGHNTRTPHARRSHIAAHRATRSPKLISPRGSPPRHSPSRPRRYACGVFTALHRHAARTPPCTTHARHGHAARAGRVHSACEHCVYSARTLRACRVRAACSPFCTSPRAGPTVARCCSSRRAARRRIIRSRVCSAVPHKAGCSRTPHACRVHAHGCLHSAAPRRCCRCSRRRAGVAAASFAPAFAMPLPRAYGTHATCIRLAAPFARRGSAPRRSLLHRSVLAFTTHIGVPRAQSDVDREPNARTTHAGLALAACSPSAHRRAPRPPCRSPLLISPRAARRRIVRSRTTSFTLVYRTRQLHTSRPPGPCAGMAALVTAS